MVSTNLIKHHDLKQLEEELRQEAEGRHWRGAVH